MEPQDARITPHPASDVVAVELEQQDAVWVPHLVLQSLLACSTIVVAPAIGSMILNFSEV